MALKITSKNRQKMAAIIKRYMNDVANTDPLIADPAEYWAIWIVAQRHNSREFLMFCSDREAFPVYPDGTRDTHLDTALRAIWREFKAEATA